MKVKAAERGQARETAKKGARQKAMDKFFEIQASKAAEKAKELERRRKAETLPSAKAKPTPAVSRITTNKMNSFEEDLGHSTNSFDDDISNPFLDDIRAASAAASALSFGGNPFDETPSFGECIFLYQSYCQSNDTSQVCLEPLLLGTKKHLVIKLYFVLYFIVVPTKSISHRNQTISCWCFICASKQVHETKLSK